MFRCRNTAVRERGSIGWAAVGGGVRGVGGG